MDNPKHERRVVKTSLIIFMISIGVISGIGLSKFYKSQNFGAETSREVFVYTNTNPNFIENPVDVGQEETEVTVMVVGDMMFNRFQTEPVEDKFVDIAGPQDNLFEGVDLLIGNLEGAFSEPREPVKLYDFAFHLEFAEHLKKYNFDAVSLANNHTLDQGNVGYEKTIATLQEVGVGYFGHQTKEVADIYTKQIDDKAVAVIGLNLTGNVLDHTLVQELIKGAEENSDYQLVMMHWGEEYTPYPTNQQTEWGRLLVDFGADAVIGSHPHVMQGMEVYKNKPILWSLGNFIFDQAFSPEVKQGLVAGLSFSESTTTVQVFPIEIEKYKPKLMTAGKEEILERFVEISSLTDREIDLGEGQFKLEIKQ